MLRHSLYPDSLSPERGPQVSLVDFFLPFLPLERSHVQRLFGMRLEEAARQLQEAEACSLAWDSGVIDFLVDKARTVPAP